MGRCWRTTIQITSRGVAKPMEPLPSHITLAHGNGGYYMRQLIEQLFAKHLANPILDLASDAATLPSISGVPMVTVDGFTVQPLEFPGGNIGSLAVHGSVNDLAVAGGKARYLTLSAIIEEGLPMEQLQQVIITLATAANEAGVQVVCGDTKVVPRGEGSGLYLTTTAIGERVCNQPLNMANIQVGDAILVSGPVGDHGAAVMLAREQFGLSGELNSDVENIFPLCEALYTLPGVRFLRDPTRGGLATVLHEIQQATGLGIRIQQQAVPLREQVSTLCEILGYDPYYLACEGRVVAVLDNQQADTALAHWRALPQGEAAAIIGVVTDEQQMVVLETELGGERVLEELGDDPLPRIC